MSGPSASGGAAEGARPPGERPGPTWRAWLLSIVAAVVLSVAATLLFGGSFRLPAASEVAAGCAAGGPCCPPQGDGTR
ncbi:MAG: hypothetical protein ACM31I_03965 [Deltaproteobacteria bacterium]